MIEAILRAALAHLMGPESAYPHLAIASVNACVADYARESCAVEMQMVASRRVETRQRCAA